MTGMFRKICAWSVCGPLLLGQTFATKTVSAQNATKAPAEGAVFSSSQSDNQSFLRFYNASAAAGTVTVTLSNFSTGEQLVRWTSPSIAAGATAQFDIKGIESSTGNFSKPAYYSVSYQSKFSGLFQHVAYRNSTSAFTNLTTCTSNISAPSSLVIDAHSSILGAGFPSTIVVNNSGSAAVPVTLGIYDADTGTKLGTYTTPAIAPNGGAIVPMNILEAGAGITPERMVPHYNVRAEGPFTGQLGHRIENKSAGATVDMTTTCTMAATPTSDTNTITATLTTAAAKAEQPAMCSAGSYPRQWEWDSNKTVAQPEPATSGTPKVEQYRDGILIATYASLGSGTNCNLPENVATKPSLIPRSCGPFGRTHVYRTWQPGDLFLIYPAVYEGEENQPWIGPVYDNYNEYLAGVTYTPTNITLRGVTVNGVRPVLKAIAASNTTLGQGLVYVDKSVGVTIENIDIDSDGATRGGKALIYINGAKDITLRDMRVHGAKGFSGNGIFGTSGNSGTLKVERVELSDNGGGSGPAHNMYINASTVDQDYTLHVLNSWSHNSVYGHLIKSRAQITKIEGSYLSGSVPSETSTQAEPYLVDVPDGGRFTMTNTVLVKNASGPNSNGILAAYAMESLPSDRTNSVTMENNTFVALTKLYDDSHQVNPIGLTYPNKVPGAANFPSIPTSIQRNVFVGFCPANSATTDYRGNLAVIAAFGELNTDYSLKTKYLAENTSILGTRSYEHRAQGGARTTTAIGARD